MRAVLQRVENAWVMVKEECVGRIGSGLLIFLGIGRDDTEKDADYLVEKTIHLRIFEDDDGKMNHSLLDRNLSALVVSQFTLWGDCRKGRRPSFTQAAPPDEAERLYQYFVDGMKGKGIRVDTGRFQAMMDVHLINDGPVTFLLDSGRLF